ncbi:MAG: 4-hydroxy-tetrahydrodipicolinate synthase [Sphingomicrobium sp.]
MFFGSIPALITPFSDGRVDEATFKDLVDWQIHQGSHALVPCGTTGESATLDFEEHHRVIAICVEQARGRVPVIAGCGSNNTLSAIANMQEAQKNGADAALVVLPYYNRPNQAGLIAHFKALTEACDLPIIVYNVPGRTVTNITVETLGEVSNLPSVIGIKDATGDLGRVTAQRAACGEQFCQLSGNDETALAFNAMGGVGCISVSANVAPKLCAEFQDATREGRWDDALTLQDKLYPLHIALFTDASPGPVKYALSKVRPGFDPQLRLPLVGPSEASRKAVDDALAHAGLI